MTLEIHIDPCQVAPETTANNILSSFGGFLAQWAINCPHYKTFREHINNHYIEPVERCIIPNGRLDNRSYYLYPEDPDLPPMLKFIRPCTGETMIVYAHAIVCFLEPNEPPIFARLD